LFVDLYQFSSLSVGAQYFDAKTYPLQSLVRASASAGAQIRLPPAVVAALLATAGSLFGDDHQSGLEPFLPADSNKHLAIPLADGDRPLYLILVTSSNPVYEFTVADINFVRNLGSILVAKSIQMRVMREDAAKTSFLSAISHELRTPMHAVTTSHALMREAINEGRLDDLDSLLSLSESSSRTLTNILNDVLDYGKGTAGDQAENQSTLVPDLVRTVVQTVKVAESQYVSESSDVNISVEHDERNWEVSLDEARFQR
jgi:signal transduction histidine kinase